MDEKDLQELFKTGGLFSRDISQEILDLIMVEDEEERRRKTIELMNSLRSDMTDALAARAAIEALEKNVTEAAKQDADSGPAGIPAPALLPSPGKPRRPSAKKQEDPVDIDFSASTPVPAWARELIETQLAIDTEDAKSAGALGYMARALVNATMPYKDPKTDVFSRKNGAFNLRIVAGYEGGIPYGIYPRLLMSWVSTEAVRKQSPVIELGDSLKVFLREVLDLRSSGGGSRGSSTRVSEQIKRLFGALITASTEGTAEKRGFRLRNVMIAQELDLNDAEMVQIDGVAGSKAAKQLWIPQENHEMGAWHSKVRLTDNFFKEIVENPVPIDLRAYKALRDSPLAMDIYTWLTYRMSYLDKPSKPIRWELLMMQFGSGYKTDLEQATRDFKKAFLKALKRVVVLYPQARLEVKDTGLVLLPSPTHVARLGLVVPGQGKLF